MGLAERALSAGRALAGRAVAEFVRAARLPLPTNLTSRDTIAHDTRLIGQQILRLGGSLKPRDLQAICARADTGYMQLLCDLGDDSRQRDGHLGSILHRRENGPGGLPWQVIPTSEGRRAVRIAAFVERAFHAMGEQLGPDGEDTADIRKTIAHMNSAIFHGYGCSEVLWRKVGRYIVPYGTLPMHARRFVYSINGVELRWWDESGPSVPYPGLDLRRDFPAGRFIVHRPRVTGGIGPREGFIRPLVWSSYFRTWTMGDWFREAELAAKPYRIGEYAPEAQDEDLAALDLAISSLTTNGWTRIPERTKLKIEYPKGANSGQNIHEALCLYLGAEESKLVLGSTLTVEQGKTGAMALGNVHAEVAASLLEADCRAIEATIRKCVIVPLVVRNFGPNAPVPEFRFLTEESTDLDKLSQALDRLLSRGLRVPARWVRATFGIPEPEDGDELVDMGKSAMAGDAPAPAPVAEGDGIEQPTPTPTEEGDEEEAEDTDNIDVEVDDRTADRLRRAFRMHAVLSMAGVRQAQNPVHVRVARNWLL